MAMRIDEAGEQSTAFQVGTLRILARAPSDISQRANRNDLAVPHSKRLCGFRSVARHGDDRATGIHHRWFSMGGLALFMLLRTDQRERGDGQQRLTHRNAYNSRGTWQLGRPPGR